MTGRRRRRNMVLKVFGSTWDRHANSPASGCSGPACSATREYPSDPAGMLEPGLQRRLPRRPTTAINDPQGPFHPRHPDHLHRWQSTLQPTWHPPFPGRSHGTPNRCRPKAKCAGSNSPGALNERTVGSRHSNPGSLSHEPSAVQERSVNRPDRVHPARAQVGGSRGQIVPSSRAALCNRSRWAW